MEPQETKSENFELPHPSGGATPEMGTGSPEHGAAPEQHSAPGAGDPAGTATAAMTAAPDPLTVLGSTTPSTHTISGHAAGLTAEDADLIEKTWVEKAKQIVAQTHGDPYTQNNEINKVKADYIKKRYNKDIKLASE